jgi:hypothetical protein
VIAGKAFTVREHVAVGTQVGTVAATAWTAGARLRYFLSPMGVNVNKPFPFNVTNVVDGAYGSGRIVTIHAPINFSPFAGAGELRSYTGARHGD